MTVGLKARNMSRSWFVPEVYEYRSAQRGVLFLESSPDDVVYRGKKTSMLPQSQISYNIFMKSEDFNFRDHVPGQIPQDIWACVTQFFSQKSVPLTPVPTQPPTPSRFSVVQHSISKQQRMLIKLYSLLSPSVEPALPQLSYQMRCPSVESSNKMSLFPGFTKMWLLNTSIWSATWILAFRESSYLYECFWPP